MINIDRRCLHPKCANLLAGASTHPMVYLAYATGHITEDKFLLRLVSKDDS